MLFSLQNAIALVVAVILIVSTSAFAPVVYVSQPTVAATAKSTTELSMGLFDKKPAAPKKEKAGDIPDFLKGRGSKSTIRQDEDNAMWVEEPKDKKDPKKKGK